MPDGPPILPYVAKISLGERLGYAAPTLFYVALWINYAGCPTKISYVLLESASHTGWTLLPPPPPPPLFDVCGALERAMPTGPLPPRGFLESPFGYGWTMLSPSHPLLLFV